MDIDVPDDEDDDAIIERRRKERQAILDRLKEQKKAEQEMEKKVQGAQEPKSNPSSAHRKTRAIPQEKEDKIDNEDWADLSREDMYQPDSRKMYSDAFAEPENRYPQSD